MLPTDGGETLVTLIDIPGFKDSGHNSTGISNEEAQAVALRDKYAQGRKFSGILYFQLISDIRVGDLAINDTQLKAFHELCGDDSGMLENVILATNRWDLVGSEEVGIQRQTDLENDLLYWEPMCLQGSQVRRFEGTRESALDLIRLVMHSTTQPLKIRQEMVNKNNPLSEGGVGGVAEAEIDKFRRGQVQTLTAIVDTELGLQKKDRVVEALLKEESERSNKEIDELRKQQEMMKADNEKMAALLREERKRVDMVKEEMEFALRKKDENMRIVLKEEAERSKKEIDELRKLQEMMRADNQKVLNLLREERELRKEDQERMESEMAQLKVDINATLQIKTLDFEKMRGEQLELALQMFRLQVEEEKAKADNEQTRQKSRKPGEKTLVTPGAEPGDIISAFQALQIKDVGDTAMQRILKEILKNNMVKEWESLLAVAPSALNALGKCFILALSGKVDKPMYARLAILLLNHAA